MKPAERYLQILVYYGESYRTTLDIVRINPDANEHDGVAPWRHNVLCRYCFDDA
jgi:hypothetical protein